MMFTIENKKGEQKKFKQGELVRLSYRLSTKGIIFKATGQVYFDELNSMTLGVPVIKSRESWGAWCLCICEKGTEEMIKPKMLAALKTFVASEMRKIGAMIDVIKANDLDPEPLKP